MKALRTLLFVAVAATIVACGGSPAAKITKKWQLSEVSIDGKPYLDVVKEMIAKQMEREMPAAAEGEEMPEEMKAAMEAAKQQVDEKMKEFIAQAEEQMKSSFFEFKEDGSYSIRMMGEDEEIGKWELSEDGKTLKTTAESEGAKSQDLTIVSVSDSELVLEGPQELEPGKTSTMKITLVAAK